MSVSTLCIWPHRYHSRSSPTCAASFKDVKDATIETHIRMLLKFNGRKNARGNKLLCEVMLSELHDPIEEERVSLDDISQYVDSFDKSGFTALDAQFDEATKKHAMVRHELLGFVVFVAV